MDGCIFVHDASCAAGEAANVNYEQAPLHSIHMPCARLHSVCTMPYTAKSKANAAIPITHTLLHMWVELNAVWASTEIFEVKEKIRLRKIIMKMFWQRGKLIYILCTATAYKSSLSAYSTFHWFQIELGLFLVDCSTHLVTDDKLQWHITVTSGSHSSNEKKRQISCNFCNQVVIFSNEQLVWSALWFQF